MIKHLRLDLGWTYRKIAGRYKITPERVRQICNKQDTKIDIVADITKVYQKKFKSANLEDLMEDINILRKPDRRKEAVTKRRLLIQYLYDEIEMPFYRIAKLLDRDHSSILNLYYDDIDDRRAWQESLRA